MFNKRLCRILKIIWIVSQYFGFWKTNRGIRLRSTIQKTRRFVADRDVTIIVPTLEPGDDLVAAIKTWLHCGPKQILIAVPEIVLGSTKLSIVPLQDERLKIIVAKAASKRIQMVEGLRHVSTELVVFADDDTWWKPGTLDLLIAPFANSAVGGAGTLQRVRSRADRFTMWEVFAAARLNGRNLGIVSSAYYNHGSVKTLSGRTVAYRTSILKSEVFRESFLGDRWNGKHVLKSGDDNFITAWIRSHGWKTFVETSPDAEVTTTMQSDWKFLKQLVRWSRNVLRSGLRELVSTFRHPSKKGVTHLVFTVLGVLLNPFCLLIELLFILAVATSPYDKNSRHLVLFHAIS
jgi:cellulose synthase/poly-beta-1,6-N-acetylglucosamine synthase-like glycosyltransferase